MPNENELTNEEKKMLIDKHHKIVDEFNTYLPNDNKISYDDNNLISRLNDSKEVKYYKTLKEIEQRIKDQKTIYENLSKKFGPIEFKKNILARSFHYGLKTENTKEANEYNEKIYKLYQENPEKVFYQRYKEVLEFDPTILLEIEGDKQKILDFYSKNQRLCHDAFVFLSTMENPSANINPTLRASIQAMAKVVENLSDPLMHYNYDKGDEYFSFPLNMTTEQALIIVNIHPEYLKPENPLKEKFYPKMNSNLQPLTGLRKIKEMGYEFGKDFFLKYKCEKYDPKTKTTKEISIEDGINKINDENIKITKRTDEEIAEMKKINRAIDYEYLNVFKKGFSFNYDEKEYNLEQLIFNNRGSFLERMFRRTSREYKEFVKTLKDYNDPNSKDYLNNERLKEKAQLYFDYKNSKGLSLNDRVGQNRLRFVSAVIRTIDAMENNPEEVTRRINYNLKEDNFIREQVVKEEEVSDDLFINKIEDNNIIINEKNLSI